MNPLVFAMRRPITTLMMLVALASGAVVSLAEMGVDLPPPLNTPKVLAYVNYIGMRAKQMKGYSVARFESYFHAHKEETHEEPRKIVAASP